jgi:hypothetical protein
VFANFSNRRWAARISRIAWSDTSSLLEVGQFQTGMPLAAAALAST